MTTQTEAQTTLEAGSPTRQPDTTIKAAKPRKSTAIEKSKNKVKASKKSKQTKVKPRSRKGSKAGKILALLQRPGGATLKDLMKSTGWHDSGRASGSHIVLDRIRSGDEAHRFPTLP